MIVTMTGEVWGTASTTIAAIWVKFNLTIGHAHSGAADDGKVIHHGDTSGKDDNDHPQYSLATAITALFHATTGHKHTAVTGDAPQLDHGILGGLSDDDHTQYVLWALGKAMSGTAFYRDVLDSLFQFRGGDLTAGSGAIYSCYGKNNASYPGAHLFFVPNAAKNANIIVINVLGNTDTPTVSLNTWKITNLGDPTDAQDAVTKHHAESHLAASMLTDYVTSTFTPILTFGGASVGITYTIQAGLYTRIGNIVTVSGHILLSNKGSSVGPVSIGGLPYTVSNQEGAYSAVALHLRSVTFANQYSGYAAINTTTIALSESTEAGVNTALANTDFVNTSRIMFNCTYRIA